jgi:uncharacterized delta-60 repeat protein
LPGVIPGHARTGISPFGMSIDDNGKIVISGSLGAGLNSDMRLTRYTDEGNLDFGFDNDGTSIFSPGGGIGAQAYQVIHDSSNNYYVAGFIETSNSRKMAVVKFDAEGDIVTTYGSSGAMVLEDSGFDQIVAVALDSSGRLVVGGTSLDGNGNTDLKLVRLLTVGSGSLDTSFGPNLTGIVSINVSDLDRLDDLVLDSEGNIWVTGLTQSAPHDNDMIVLRVKDNGQLDNTFNATGILRVEVSGNQRGRRLVFDTDKFYVLSENDSKLEIRRYSMSGVQDLAYGVTGLAHLPQNTLVRAAALVGGGGLLVAGEATRETQGTSSNGSTKTKILREPFVARFLSDGTLDEKYGIGGVMRVPLGKTAVVRDMAIVGASTTAPQVIVTSLVEVPDSEAGSGAIQRMTLIRLAANSSITRINDNNAGPSIFTADAADADIFDIAPVGPITLGSYLGRLPVFDPDGDSMTYTIGGGTSTLPPGLVTVDPDTGDLYLGNKDQWLAAANALHTLAFTATDVHGVVLNGVAKVRLPAPPNINDQVSDAFRDSGSHRDGITFDLRPTGQSAAGELLYTTLLNDDGIPYLPGAVVPDTVGGFQYGTYSVDDDGMVRYQPAENLYKEKFSEFGAGGLSSVPDGMSYLARPAITLALVSMAQATATRPVGQPKIESTRQATQRLSNSKPVSYATGQRTGIYQPGSIDANDKDMFGIDLNQWFFDPDGDEVYLAGLSGVNQKVLHNFPGTPNTTPTPNAPPTDVLRLDFDTLDSDFVGTIGIFIDDHPLETYSPAEILKRAEIRFGDVEWTEAEYHLPQGVTKMTFADRVNEAGGTVQDFVGFNSGSRHEEFVGWRDRWSSWKVSETASNEMNSGALKHSVGNASVDLTDGQVTAYEDLNLQDAFDEVSVALGGLVYDSQTVKQKYFSQVKITRPEDEDRDIQKFMVRVLALDYSEQSNMGDLGFLEPSYNSPTESFEFVTDAPQADHFELTVPLSSVDMLDSGIFRYQIMVQPVFAPRFVNGVEQPVANHERDLRFRTTGQVTVLKQRRVEPKDFNPGFFGTASYANFAPEFGEGWQLNGIPRLVYSTNDININPSASEFNSLDGIEAARATVTIHMPGSSKPHTFLSSKTNDEFVDLYKFSPTNVPTFTPYDLQFTGTNAQEYASLTMDGDNHSITYTDASGTQYKFERFNQAFYTDPDTLETFSIEDGVPAPQWLVTEINPPDELGLRIKYRDASASPTAEITPSGSGAANFAGPIQIRSIMPAPTPGITNYGGLTFGYDGIQVNSITFADGRVTSFGYDGDHLNQITRPENSKTIFEHTPVGSNQLLSNIKSSTGSGAAEHEVKFVYNSNGYIEKVQVGADGDNPVITELKTLASRAFAPSGATNPTAFAASRPQEPWFADEDRRYDSIAGQVSIETLAGDLQAYDPQTGTPIAKAGRFIETIYLDSRGNPVIFDSAYKQGDTRTTTSRSLAQYDGFDNVVHSTDTLGRETSFVYDYTYTSGEDVIGVTPHTGAVRENVVITASPAGVERVIREGQQLSAMGAPKTVVDVLGRVTKYEYDSDGRLTKATDHRKVHGTQANPFVDSNRQTEYEYTDGRLVKTTDPLGLITQYAYENTTHTRLPSKITTTQPAVAGVAAQRVWTQTIQYDPHGYIDTITTEKNNLTISTENHDYDELGRLVSMTVKEGADGITLRHSTYGYDSLGRQISMTDGRGALHTTDYDSAGRIIQTVSADGATFVSHAAGILADVSQTTNYTYFADGSPKSTLHPDGSTSTFYFDPTIITAFGSINTQSLSTKLGARVAAHQWTVTDGVASGTNPNAKQAVLTVTDELGRQLRQEDLLSGALVDSYFLESWTDSASKLVRKTNLGSATDNKPTSNDVVDIVQVLATDRAGQVFRSQSTGHAAEVALFDALGYLALHHVSAPFGLTQFFVRDVQGNATQQTQIVSSPGQSAIQARTTKTDFDANSNPRRITDALNRVTSINLLTQQVMVDLDGDGPVSGSNRILETKQITTPDGASTIEQRDVSGQVVRSVGAFGGITTNSLNAAGDLISTHYHDPQASLTVTPPGTPTSLALDTAPDRLTQYVPDSLGRLRETKFVGNGGFSVYQDYLISSNGAGQTATIVTNPHGGVTRTTMDALGKTTQIIAPNLAATGSEQTSQTFTYDYKSNEKTLLVTSIVDAVGGTAAPLQKRTTKQLLSDDGRVLIDAVFAGVGKGDSSLQNSIVQLLQGTPIGDDYIVNARNRYTRQLDLEFTRDAGNFKTEFTYDHPSEGPASAGTGKRIQSYDDKRGVTVENFNSVGQRVMSRDVANNEVTWKYDAVGRPIEELTKVPVGRTEANPTVAPRARDYFYSDPGIVSISDRDGETTTISIDYVNRAQTTFNATDEHAAYFNGDGSIVALHNFSKLTGNAYGDGLSRIVNTYDALGRLTSETTITNQPGIVVPGSKYSYTYEGFTPLTRTIATAPAGQSTGFTDVATSSYTLDDLGRTVGVNQMFNGSTTNWKSGQLPDSIIATATFNLDGQVGQVIRRNMANAPMFQSDYQYSLKGELEKVTHTGAGGSTIGRGVASHEILRTQDGRAQTASATVSGNNGQTLATASGQYNYDSYGNPSSVTPAAGNEDLNLIPGFKPQTSTGQTEGSHSRSAQNRQLGNSDHLYRYDNEGRLVYERQLGELNVTQGSSTRQIFEGKLRRGQTRDSGLAFKTVRYRILVSMLNLEAISICHVYLVCNILVPFTISSLVGMDGANFFMTRGTTNALPRDYKTRSIEVAG